MKSPLSSSLIAFLVLAGLTIGKIGIGQEPNPIAVNQGKGIYTILILHDGENTDSLTRSIVPLANATENCSALISPIGNPKLKRLFRELRLDPETAPTPLAIALAPNNIVTGVFLKPPSPQAFEEAILPPQQLAVRKALFDGKSVIVKMQSSRTKGNTQSDAGLNDFFSIRKNRKQFIALPLDLHASENAAFIRQLGIEPSKETESLIIALAPPLKVINDPFRGAAKKADIEKAVTPCCPPGVI